MNKIYLNSGSEPLTDEQIAELAGAKTTSPAVDRLINGYICECKKSGEFELMRKNPPSTTGPYLRCRKCGCVCAVKKGEGI